VMDDDQIEHTLYVNRDVKVYRIPPRPAAGGHSSGTWRVDDCIFTGELLQLHLPGSTYHASRPLSNLMIQENRVSNLRCV
jgi:hypothetical protein